MKNLFLANSLKVAFLILKLIFAYHFEFSPLDFNLKYFIIFNNYYD